MKKPFSYEAFLKSPEPCFKHTTYFDVYDVLFKKYQNKTITFVEIGVLNGGSLFMWRNFFGKKARIIGIDLNPNAKKWEDEGFEIFVGNQADPDFWEQFKTQVPCVDILLDDGGHTYIQQIVTTESALDIIKDGGMLIIEDTHTSYTEGFGKKDHNFIQYSKFWIDKINSRFGGFDRKQTDTRVWSIEIFESIVVFKKNQKAAQLMSKPLWNREPQKKEKDFREFGNEENKKITQNILKLLKRAFNFYDE